MKRVLVTGGNGFIGAAVVAELQRCEIEALVFSLPQDIRDAREVSKAVNGCDGVIHLAGVLGTHELFDTIELAIDVNIKGTVNVLDACVKHGAKYVGITMPQVFPSVYTATKIAATRLASAYHRTYDLPVTHVRAYNAFGPGQAHGPGHPQKIIPTFAVNAWYGTPVPIWGDGSQSVDLISTRQLARVLRAALFVEGDYTIDGGTGKSFTVFEVAKLVADIVGVNLVAEFLPMRRGEVPTHIVAEDEGWSFLDHADRPFLVWDDFMNDLTEAVMFYRSWKGV